MSGDKVLMAGIRFMSAGSDAAGVPIIPESPLGYPKARPCTKASSIGGTPLDGDSVDDKVIRRVLEGASPRGKDDQQPAEHVDATRFYTHSNPSQVPLDTELGPQGPNVDTRPNKDSTDPSELPPSDSLHGADDEGLGPRC